MAQAKKKSTAKKKTTSKKKEQIRRKKKNDNPIRYVIAILVVVLMVLGVFQLGIIGRLIDSFFNYLFGYSRYLTYILVLLATGFITYSKRIPKTRRTAGSIVLQIALLFVSQLVFILIVVSKLKENLYFLMCISHTNTVISQILVAVY